MSDQPPPRSWPSEPPPAPPEAPDGSSIPPAGRTPTSAPVPPFAIPDERSLLPPGRAANTSPVPPFVAPDAGSVRPEVSPPPTPVPPFVAPDAGSFPAEVAPPATPIPPFVVPGQRGGSRGDPSPIGTTPVDRRGPQPDPVPEHAAPFGAPGAAAPGYPRIPSDPAFGDSSGFPPDPTGPPDPAFARPTGPAFPPGATAGPWRPPTQPGFAGLGPEPSTAIPTNGGSGRTGMSTTNFVLLVAAVVIGLPLVGAAIVIAAVTHNASPSPTAPGTTPRITTSTPPVSLLPSQLDAAITLCDAQSNTAVASGSIRNTLGRPASFRITVSFTDGDTHQTVGKDVDSRTDVVAPDQVVSWQALTIAAPTGSTLECTIRRIVEE